MEATDFCKNCNFFKPETCACTHWKRKVSPKTQSCPSFSKEDAKSGAVVNTCGSCRHGYFPDKSYPNYMAYINYNGEFFMCKCSRHPFAKFLKQKACPDYEKN